MSTTIFSLLQLYSQPKDDLYDGLLIRTKSGGEYEGSLVNWNPMSAPSLICITGDRGRKTYLDRESIESVSIINPAR
jgi:hypothetical protein